MSMGTAAEPNLSPFLNCCRARAKKTITPGAGLAPAPLPVVSFHGHSGVLGRDEGVAFVFQPDALTGSLADNGKSGGGVLNAPSPIDGRHAPAEICHAPVGTGALEVRRCSGERAGMVEAVTKLANRPNLALSGDYRGEGSVPLLFLSPSSSDSLGQGNSQPRKSIQVAVSRPFITRGLAPCYTRYRNRIPSSVK